MVTSWFVSVLFSEPKIPQSRVPVARMLGVLSFSALQRAENSSIASRVAINRDRQKFQCSSASRKFLNLGSAPEARSRRERFSALQRAENSSIEIKENDVL